ncbi:hypothetical protein IHG71_004522 [Salmonella enterica]|nr:hypothetical protein [Salmonella enterica]EFU5988659.1 hypothetical protein [Salmonella enterica subsp. enterica serovar Brandenburg]EFR4658088.1 hypothetical protein [Salmonella enterica]EFU9141532.1 hypothetical protein [Salmonella enterica]EGD0708890.1 hypothetical protein [Salmonella enterica subsp. enterica serovar Brandenburg]
MSSEFEPSSQKRRKMSI